MYKKIFIILLVLLSQRVFGDVDELWELFLEQTDSRARAELLVNLGMQGKGNQNVIDNINNYLMEMNSLYKAGTNVDYSLVSAFIAVVMDLGDSPSFPVLFDVLRAGYPEVIIHETYGALDLIGGDLKHFLFDILERNPPEDKLLAFKTGINSERLSISERGQLMELALELAITSVEEDAYLDAMRYAAVTSLASLRWTRANALAMRHYYRVQADFAQGIVPKSRLIEAIACLGAVGSSDAALVLGLQLGLINARAARSGAFDPDITLAIVQALGLIGDNAAFDHLLYASNLSYDDNITAAAREAISRLKW